jgi:serine/threonine protein kinase
MGKYPYMSPEQVRLEGTDGRSDLFALGIILFEMLTLRKLLPVKTREDLMRLFDDGNFPAPKSINPKVPSDLNDIVMSMLSIEKSNRPSSARKLVVALEKHMYSKGYGPTNEKLAIYMRKIFAQS